MIGYQIVFFDFENEISYYSNVFKNKKDAEKIISFYKKPEFFDIMSIILGKDWYDKSWDIEFYNMKNAQEKIDTFKKYYKEVWGKDTNYSDGMILGTLYISKNFEFLKGSCIETEIKTILIY